MNKVDLLYAKPKSLLRGLTQRLFLKILSKLFPKKFLSYKNKIRFIMNRGAYFGYLYLAAICLRFRYPSYYNLPSRQIYALHITIKFLKITFPPLSSSRYQMNSCSLRFILS